MTVNQEYPFDISVGIIETVMWLESVPDIFYIEVRDSRNVAANITISITKNTCSVAEETDKSFSLRANLWIKIFNTSGQCPPYG